MLYKQNTKLRKAAAEVLFCRGLLLPCRKRLPCKKGRIIYNLLILYKKINMFIK